jgi:hypothetical protein
MSSRKFPGMTDRAAWHGAFRRWKALSLFLRRQDGSASVLETPMFMTLRFASRLCFEGVCASAG